MSRPPTERPGRRPARRDGSAWGEEESYRPPPEAAQRDPRLDCDPRFPRIFHRFQHPAEGKGRGLPATGRALLGGLCKTPRPVVDRIRSPGESRSSDGGWGEHRLLYGEPLAVLRELALFSSRCGTSPAPPAHAVSRPRFAPDKGSCTRRSGSGRSSPAGPPVDLLAGTRRSGISGHPGSPPGRRPSVGTQITPQANVAGRARDRAGIQGRP